MVRWCTQLRSQQRTLTLYTYPMEFSPCSCQELLPSWANLQSEELPSKTFPASDCFGFPCHAIHALQHC